ncbi:MAG: hypothetical protein M1835_001549 [Candelina submexicana]|nr:MAG: hypothetical protein M1835_001549 [Candelina submexicana]
MRIRIPFACAFLFLLLASAYLGLTSLQTNLVNDKVLHFVTFFFLTICFYWILDTSRRRNLNFTLITCTLILGIGSEFLQSFLDNGRKFDPYDILSNLVGSLSALALCSWYHKRMLDRKRQAKHYHIVPGDEENFDVELGEGVGAQEDGAVESAASLAEGEAENWDAHGDDDWDDEGPAGTESLDGEGPKTPSSGSAGDEMADGKKRNE